MTTKTDDAHCARCGRPAPPELDGPAGGDAGPWHVAEWEVFGEDAELVCPGCLTDEDHEAIYESMLDFDPVVQISRLVDVYDAKLITNKQFEDSLAKWGGIVEEMEEGAVGAIGQEDIEHAAETRRVYDEAVARLPPESVGDMAAKAYRGLEELREKLHRNQVAPEILDKIDELLDD